MWFWNCYYLKVVTSVPYSYYNLLDCILQCYNALFLPSPLQGTWLGHYVWFLPSCLSVSMLVWQSNIDFSASFNYPFPHLYTRLSLFIFSPQTYKIKEVLVRYTQTYVALNPKEPLTQHKDKMTSPPPLLLECFNVFFSS